MEASRRFKASPLSLAVPDGEFKRWMHEQEAGGRSAQEEPSFEAAALRDWPAITSLTMNDLTGAGQEWVEFLGVKGGLAMSYGLLKDWALLRRRIDENVARFIVRPRGQSFEVYV